MNKGFQEIWYVSKYAISPKYGNPTRQYFFSKYMAKKGRNVFLVSSRSIPVKSISNFGFKNQLEYTSENVKGILLNGPQIDLGFNIKRIFSWIVFEFRFIYWALFKKERRPDVIIVSSLSLLTFLTGSILKKFFNCKLVCEVRDIWPLTIIETKGWNKKNLFIRFLSFIENIGYKNADIIIGSMPNLKEHVGNISEKFALKVKNIPMGFDPDFWNISNEKLINDPFQTFFANKIPDNHFVVGYAGTIGLVNCVDQIIEAAKNLQNEYISFVLLGNGVLKDQLVRECNQLNLKNVYFLEPVPKNQVLLFLEKCDLLLNPWKGGNTLYKYGVSPNKWIDYMYSAKPILVSLDGFQSIINEANCGKFIKADDIKELTKEIYEFSKMNPVQLKEMGLNGRNYLLSNMTYEILTEKYLKLIDELK